LEQRQQFDRKWYVTQTKPRNEETARFHLNSKGIEVFYPKLSLPISEKNTRRCVSLFPNYLFVRIAVSSPEYCQVTWCPGVKRLISFGGKPAVIEEHVINLIQDQADKDGLIAAKSSLKVGDQVQIAEGPFKGLVGIIQQPPDAKSRVKVLMELLSRPVQVEVPAGYINMGWVAACAV